MSQSKRKKGSRLIQLLACLRSILCRNVQVVNVECVLSSLKQSVCACVSIHINRIYCNSVTMVCLRYNPALHPGVALLPMSGRLSTVLGVLPPCVR